MQIGDGKQAMLQRVALAVGIAAAVLGFAPSDAHASYVITINEVGSDVVASGSGSLDLTGLTPQGSVNWESLLIPSDGKILVGSTTTERLYFLPGPAVSFGTGGFIDATSSSGTAVAISGGIPAMYIASTYVSGTTISATSTWANKTFNTLGLTEGSHSWTLPSSDTISVVIQAVPSAVPEPASIALLGVPLAFTLLGRRRSA